MDSETKKQVLEFYKRYIERKIQEVKEEIKDELVKIDEKESFLTGNSELGDMGRTCSNHNLINSLNAMRAAKLDYMTNCLTLIQFDSKEPINLVKALSIVKVKYST
ncbi:MAG: hypothetical protein Q7T50_02550, partial [Candidatus Magasanikbacteria bacterium]|nr:hypothetical protein [Candidatus Magasanikbacteria bacterium]